MGKWHVSSPASGVQAYFRGEHGRFGLVPNTTAAEGAAAAELQRGYTEARYRPLPPAATRPLPAATAPHLLLLPLAPQARKELHADVERSGFNYSGAPSVA